jgi:dolichyl-phosphate beta-glucosyltransferase
MSDPEISLIIPAYNEGPRIAATLARVCGYFDAQPYAWEVIVVRDGGRPDTTSQARAAAGARANVRVIDNEENHGKGFAVRQGFSEARGRTLIFIDADLSLPVEAVAAMRERFLAGADVVIASRRVPGAREEGTPFPLRGVMGRVFNVIVQAIAVRGYKDTQCGCKGFRAEAARKIFAAQTIDRFGFDVEVLYLAQQLGYRIDEIPVVCTYHAGSSVNRAGDVLRMLADLVKIRWRHL